MRDETQLIQAVLTGDTDAFGDLVTKYQNRLFNTMFHVAGSREEAEDIVQEAFVQDFIRGFIGLRLIYPLAVGVADGLSHLSMLFVMRPVPSLKTIVTNLHSE